VRAKLGTGEWMPLTRASSAPMAPTFLNTIVLAHKFLRFCLPGVDKLPMGLVHYSLIILSRSN
jgi:hypothetical protein